MELMTIGRFAALVQVPVKTLRYWAEVGVLEPVELRGAHPTASLVIPLYERLAVWAAVHDRRLGDPPYEVYHSGPDDPPEAQRLQVVWPLAR